MTFDLLKVMESIPDEGVENVPRRHQVLGAAYKCPGLGVLGVHQGDANAKHHVTVETLRSGTCFFRKSPNDLIELCHKHQGPGRFFAFRDGAFFGVFCDVCGIDRDNVWVKVMVHWTDMAANGTADHRRYSCHSRNDSRGMTSHV